MRIHDPDSIAEDAATHGKEPASKPSTASSVNLNSLPPEVRLRIYRKSHSSLKISELVDSHLHKIHVITRRPLEWKLYPFYCNPHLSEAETYQKYAEPAVFKDMSDWQTRRRVELQFETHLQCHKDWLELLDLRLLRVSREFRLEATKLLYSTNTWSFNSTEILEDWLNQIPKDALPYVRRLRLEINITYYANWRPYSTAPLWKETLHRLGRASLTGMRSLSLVIQPHGNITCCRKSQGTALRDIFRPLKIWKGLKGVYVVFNEAKYGYGYSYRTCAQLEHDAETHGQRNYKIVSGGERKWGEPGRRRSER